MANPINVTACDNELILLAYQWGGPQVFSATVNRTLYSSPAQSSGDGLVWNPGPISFTV